MKKFIIGSLLIATAVIAQPNKKITIHAQSLPVTKLLLWDVDPNTDTYTVLLDGIQIGTPATNSQQFTITTVGQHNLSVSATNIWGSSSPTVLNFNVIVPGKPGNLRIQ